MEEVLTPTICENTGVSVYDRTIEMAFSQNASLEQLEKFLGLKQKHDAYEAQKAFYEALSAFHQEKITIKKDKYNNHFKSWYCSLGNLLETVNPFLGKHGLSVRFVPTQSDKMLSVECVLQHRLGHTESVSMSAPPDTSGGGSKNPIQQVKSTFTYLRSATFEAVTGLSGTEASGDDDGNGAVDSEKPKQKQELLPSNTEEWQRAVAAYKRDKNFNTLEKHRTISEENKALIKKDAEEEK